MQTSELQLAIDFALYEIPHYALTRLSHPQWNDPLCFILSSCESFFRNASLTFVCWNSVNDPCWWQGICCVDLVRVATSWYFRWSKWFVFIPKHVFEDLGRNCLVADLGLVNVYELAILIKCASLVVLFAHCTWMACCFMEIKSFWRPRCERSHQLKSAAPSLVAFRFLLNSRSLPHKLLATPFKTRCRCRSPIQHKPVCCDVWLLSSYAAVVCVSMIILLWVFRVLRRDLF